ncbi:hypothetical protein D3C86_834540 [compost metagenome]
MKPVLPFRALIPAALAAIAMLSAPAGAQPAAAAPTTAMPQPDVTPTRADVERDLAAWKNAGVERQWDTEETPNINSPQYVADYRKYLETVRPGSTSPSSMPSGSQNKW